MSRARGNALQNALARYLAQWWQYAESAGAGRNGTDVVGTPGVVWECKTASDFKRDFRPAAWVRQAAGHGLDLNAPNLIPANPPVSVVVYFPPGVGEMNTASAMAIVPLHVLMRVLEEAQYTPSTESSTGLPTGVTT